MGRLIANLYDWMLRGTEEACLRQWRRELLEPLHGNVLEIGAGTGLNIPWYPERVRRLALIEPDRFMRRELAEKRRNADEPSRVGVIDIEAAYAESLPFRSESFDAVVSTLVLCSVNDLEAALTEIDRVLVTGGRLVFIEHVAATSNPRRLRWQRRIEPLWKWLSGNCHLTRDTEMAIERAGFEIQQIERSSLRKAIPLVRPSIRGHATKV